MNRSTCLRSIIVSLICSVGGLAVSVGYGQEQAPVNESTLAEQDTVAVDAAKKLVLESQRLFEKELKPLKEEFRAKTARLKVQVDLQTQYLERLKSADDNSLATVRQEMQQTADRLKMLERIESVLADMNPDSIEKAIVEGNREVSEMLQQREAVIQPINEQQSLIYRANRHRNEALTKVINPFFKDAGVDELSGLVRKHPKGNFASSRYTCRYENGRENIRLNVTLEFQTALTSAGRVNEMIDDKHVVYQWNDNQVIVLLNGMQLSVVNFGSNLKKQKLMMAVTQLIDLDGLSRLAE